MLHMSFVIALEIAGKAVALSAKLTNLEFSPHKMVKNEPFPYTPHEKLDRLWRGQHFNLKTNPT